MFMRVLLFLENKFALITEIFRFHNNAKEFSPQLSLDPPQYISLGIAAPTLRELSPAVKVIVKYAEEITRESPPV